MRHQRVSGAQLLLVLIVLSVASAGQAANLQCKKAHVYGKTPIGPIAFPKQSDAANAARQNWVANCAIGLGPSPISTQKCDWSKAIGKEKVCNRVPNGFGGYNHSCTVKARPCWDEF